MCYYIVYNVKKEKIMLNNSETNPYYSNATFSSNTSLKNAKENSFYVLKVLINLLDNEGRTVNLPAPYRQQIMSGKLLHNLDKNDSATAEKLKALIKFLDDKNNREKFCNSYFYIALIALRNGARDINSKDLWINYTLKGDSYLKNKGALNNALTFYKDDANITNIGLDIGAFLDAIVTKNDRGEYVMTDIPATKADLLIDAVIKTVDLMKNSEKFKSNYRNNYLNNEDENE